MTTQTMMTETTATTTTESQTASTAESNPATDAPGQAGEQSATQQQATEGQGTQEQGANTEGDQGKTDDKGDKQGAPEKYEFAAPEGVELDPTVLGKFSEVAKKHNLTQDVAQDILSEMAPQMAAQQAEHLQVIRTQWVEQAKTDKEFGGDGLQENLAVAKKAMDAFGSPELRELLNTSGFGDNPEVVRFFFRAGKAISEDRMVTGSRNASAQPNDPAKRLFPNQA